MPSFSNAPLATPISTNNINHPSWNKFFDQVSLNLSNANSAKSISGLSYTSIGRMFVINISSTGGTYQLPCTSNYSLYVQAINSTTSTNILISSGSRTIVIPDTTDAYICNFVLVSQ